MVEEYTLLVKEKNISRYSAKIRKIILYTDFHYPEPLSLEYFAWNLNVSKTYLSHLFRQELGVPLTEYIRKVRMEKAAKLLKTSSLTLEEVAKSVGHANPNYFTLHFKATYHITPKQFQKTAVSGFQPPGHIPYCQLIFFHNFPYKKNTLRIYPCGYFSETEPLTDTLYFEQICVILEIYYNT